MLYIIPWSKSWIKEVVFGGKQWATIISDCNTASLGCDAQLSKISRILQSDFKSTLLQCFWSFVKLLKNQCVMKYFITQDFGYFYKLLETVL